MPLELLHSLAAWAVILPAAFFAGTFWAPLIPYQDRITRGILFYALGFATLFAGVVVLSAAHLLSAPYIWALLFLPLIFRFRQTSEWFRWLRDLWKDFLPGPGVFSRLLFVFFAVSFICLLLGTLTPELGGDALCYQLNIPKMFLLQGSIAPNYLDYNSYYPLFMNDLYLIGLATGGGFAAKLFHFFCGFLLFVLIRRLLDGVSQNKTLSTFVALAVWLTPTAYNLMSTTYVDVALAFYTLLATMVLADALESGKLPSFLLSGIIAGCCIAIKYLALVSVLGWLGVWLYSLIRSRRLGVHFAGGVCFVIGILTVPGYWFIRNAHLTGNPLFPYLGTFFGGETRVHADFYVFGLGNSFFHFVSLYFNMFLSPNAFGTATTRIGIFYFLFLPFVLFAIARVPRARVYGIFWLVCTTVIFFIGQADRWILPVLPVMAVCGGMGIRWFYGYASTFLKKMIRFGIGTAAVLCLSVYFLAGIYHYRFAYLLYSGSWSIEKYLTSLERTTTVAEWANQNLPKDSKILAVQENRLFYFDRPVVRYFFFDWRYKDPSWSHPAGFTASLKKHGITHLLLSEPVRRSAGAFKQIPEVAAILNSSALKELYRAESRNIREDRYVYHLYEIK